jgi:hypothetical protein
VDTLFYFIASRIFDKLESALISFKKVRKLEDLQNEAQLMVAFMASRINSAFFSTSSFTAESLSLVNNTFFKLTTKIPSRL